MTFRIEVEVLQSGQPRAYADTVYNTRVTFTYQVLYGPEKGLWVPWIWFDQPDRKEKLLACLREMPQAGYVEPPYKNWASTRLDSLTNPSPGVWEIRTHSSYTD